jgi:hypothetical protein
MPRHPLDPLSLVLGLGFCALGIAALGTWVDIRHVDTDWVAPIVLVLLGLALFGSILARSFPGPVAAEGARPAAGPGPRPSSADGGAGEGDPTGTVPGPASHRFDEAIRNLPDDPGVGEGSGPRDT